MAALARRREIMAELFDRHDGRQVNTWGDAVIAEFSSVVEAVRCAIDIQEAVATENTLSPPALEFRIGVNLGDVMLDGQDIYGDGVNVAARLQELSEPGGVIVSGAVHDLTHKQIAIGFDFMGEQKVREHRPAGAQLLGERAQAKRAARGRGDGGRTFRAQGPSRIMAGRPTAGLDGSGYNHGGSGSTPGSSCSSSASTSCSTASPIHGSCSRPYRSHF